MKTLGGLLLSIYFIKLILLNTRLVRTYDINFIILIYSC